MGKRSVTIEFNGLRFRRYPDAKGTSDRVYYKPSGADRKRGIGSLHQEVWKHHQGRDIPAGFHVHHDDHDTENNAPSNLVLVEGKDHARHHMQQPGRMDAFIASRGRAQELAAEWHGSPEGIAWHSEHGKRTWDNRETTTRECDQCGETYPILEGVVGRFCTNKCKSKWRRDSGIDNVTVPCEACGKPFTKNKYEKQRTCSRLCGQAIRTDRKR